MAAPKTGRCRLPSRDGLHAELVDHAHSATGYTCALCWTHLFLPMFGQADLFQRSPAELMELHIPAWHKLFIWAYTAVITTICWLLYVFAEKRVASLSSQSAEEIGALSTHVSVATWGTLATSLVYVTVWAWICALLSVLPTGNPLLAFLSGGLVTVIAAFSIVGGQRGCGPFLLLRGSKPERMKTVVFFTTIMTAMMWVGALDYAFVYLAPQLPRWVGAWSVALVLVITRWVMLWNSRDSSSGLFRAVRYPSTPDLALSVGLVAQSREQSREKSRGFLGLGNGVPSAILGLGNAMPSVIEMREGTLGLGALVIAWSGSVALQAASTTTWQAWPWAYTSVHAVAPATGYALAMTTAGVFAVATARVVAEADGMAQQRAGALASETAALGVASGWTWYHALECIFPSLCDPSPLTRVIGSIVVTAFGVMVMLALKPPAGTAYSGTPSRTSSRTPSRTPSRSNSIQSCEAFANMGGRSSPGGRASPWEPSLKSQGEGEEGTSRDCSPTSTRYRAFVDMRREHSADWLPSTLTQSDVEAGLAPAAPSPLAVAVDTGDRGNG